MARHSSSEEVRAAKIAAMGAPLGELHFALSNEVTWLHLKWKDYRTLFAHSQERIDLLNEAAPDFFGNLHRTLWEDVLLHLCRLTDPPKSMGRDNLTILQLPLLIEDIGLHEQVKNFAALAAVKTQFARDRRNRRLAHLELPDFDVTDSKPLAAASRQHVEDALAAIREAMNCVEVHYQDSPVAYEHSIEALGGVDSLLACLEKGLKEKGRRKVGGIS
jgi:hypothetical protein